MIILMFFFEMFDVFLIPIGNLLFVSFNVQGVHCSGLNSNPFIQENHSWIKLLQKYNSVGRYTCAYHSHVLSQLCDEKARICNSPERNFESRTRVQSLVNSITVTSKIEEQLGDGRWRVCTTCTCARLATRQYTTFMPICQHSTRRQSHRSRLRVQP